LRRHAAITGDLEYSDSGPDSKPVTLLIHSLGTDRTMWRAQHDLLRAGRRVIAVDLPGHGGSLAGPGPYAIEDLGDDMLGVLRAARVDTFEVVGVSLGGLIGLWMAANLPDRVEALIAANTSSRLGSPELWAERIEAVERGGMDSIRESVVRRFFAADFETESPGEFDRFSEIFSATDPEGYAGCCAALRDADLTREVGAIACPTLIVGGDQDIATPPDHQRRLHETISGSRLEIISGAGHLSNVDRPGRFNQVLQEFLRL
jgi:3-oxoadipate enol-lactonase